MRETDRYIIRGLLLYQNLSRKRHNEKLRALNAELDEANRIKTRFFSILNHDLRSPVSNLIQFLHLKKENTDLLDEATETRLEQKTLSGAENLLNTMEDLLLWSKGQMENFEPQIGKVEISHLFEDIDKQFSGNDLLSIRFENPQNLTLHTDENYLKTIAYNLTSNAVKAMKDIPKPEIIWRAVQEKEQIIISITDNGPGADHEIFKALYDDKQTIGIKSGLGMHIIRDLAKAIQCKIEVVSEQRKGTTIRLLFIAKSVG